MNFQFFKVKNYTEAVRGKNYLRSLNIQSTVEKVTGKGGCGYAIKTAGNAERVSRLLSTAGINVIEISRAKG